MQSLLRDRPGIHLPDRPRGAGDNPAL